MIIRYINYKPTYIFLIIITW